MRKRIIAALAGILALLLAAVGLGVGLSWSTASTPSAAGGSPSPSQSASSTTELETLADTSDELDEADATDETDESTTGGTTPTTPGGSATNPPAPGITNPPVDDEEEIDEQLPTLPEPPADVTGPTITVKPELSTGGPTAYSRLSLKLYDAGQVDYVEVNGERKELTNNAWSDVNFITVGSYGITDGQTVTVVAYDVAGNSTTQSYVLDGTGPTITVKPESVGGPSVFGKLSLKLYDRFQVDYVVINGTTKELTNNQWSDVNELEVGQFGIQDGTPFTVVAFDVAGNSTTQTFTLDQSGPTITVKPESVGGPNAYKLLSLKLYDKSQVDYVVINGTTKQLTNNQWSDVNGLKVGQYGIQDGVPFTVEAYDVFGNVTVATFVFDLTGPTITVKPDLTIGGPGVYSSLSLKLYDAYQVDYVKVNGVTKDLTNNPWSDVNFLTVGSFGIQDGVPFTVEAFDVLGNSTVATFTLDGTAPTATEKSRTATSVSLKLFDKFSVDYVVINGTKKELSNNPWSDANDIKIGSFGIQDGVPFSVVVVDVAGNSSTYWFTLSAPVVDPDPYQTNFSAPVEEPVVTEDETASE